MAKDDDRTNEPEEAGKWGTAGKSSGKNNKNGKGKESKTDRRIDKVSVSYTHLTLPTKA